MRQQCVVHNGKIINVGPWKGSTAMPAGSQVAEAEIARTADDKIVMASDYRALRAAEYPSIGDQLDALYHAGLFPPEMAALLTAVKAKYPKG